MQIHLAKMNYKDKDATINPARGRHWSWLGDSTKHTALKLCFQSQPLTKTKLACPYCLFRFCLSCKKKRRGYWIMKYFDLQAKAHKGEALGHFMGCSKRSRDVCLFGQSLWIWYWPTKQHGPTDHGRSYHMLSYPFSRPSAQKLQRHVKSYVFYPLAPCFLPLPKPSQLSLMCQSC